MIAYSDFECPYCASFARETLPRIIDSYVKRGDLLLSFHHLPLERIHRNALSAAVAAECAGAQGKFWEMHDELFLHQDQLGRDLYFRAATRIGLAHERFDRCLSGEMTELVKQGAAAAGKASVVGTPTFLFGTVQPDGRVKVASRAAGALSFDAIANIVDTLVQKSKAGI